MVEKKPLLSICIPTYNRAEYLEKSLESIIRQPEFHSDDVEVVISDNCSTDNTEELCRKYATKYSNIHYFRNEVNIRDENFPTVLSEAKGEFRKLSNDTVYYHNGSIKYILKILKRNRGKQIFFFHKKLKRNLKIKGMELFMYNVSFYITSITCEGFWDCDCENIKNKTYACDKHLWQVPFLLKIIKEKKDVIIVRKKIYDMLPVKNKDISYGLYQVFYENYLGLIAEFVKSKDISVECYNWLEKDLLFNYFSLWFNKVKNNAKDYKLNESENFFTLIQNAYKNKTYYSYFIFVSKLKGFLNEFIECVHNTRMKILNIKTTNRNEKD